MIKKIIRLIFGPTRITCHEISLRSLQDIILRPLGMSIADSFKYGCTGILHRDFIITEENEIRSIRDCLLNRRVL